MSTFRKHLVVVAITILTLFVGSAREGRAGVAEASRPGNCRNLPIIKNLTGLKAQHVCDRMSASKELTKGEIKKLAARAKSAEDHLTVARFYRVEAHGLDGAAIVTTPVIVHKRPSIRRELPGISLSSTASRDNPSTLSARQAAKASPKTLPETGINRRGRSVRLGFSSGGDHFEAGPEI